MYDIEEISLKTGIPIKIVTLSCPKCNANLTAKDAINYVRTGIQKNSMTYNFQHNWFDTEEYEFDSDGIFEEYTCVKCDADISAIIKNYI